MPTTPGSETFPEEAEADDEAPPLRAEDSGEGEAGESEPVLTDWAYEGTTTASPRRPRGAERFLPVLLSLLLHGVPIGALAALYAGRYVPPAFQFAHGDGDADGALVPPGSGSAPSDSGLLGSRPPATDGATDRHIPVASEPDDATAAEAFQFPRPTVMLVDDPAPDEQEAPLGAAALNATAAYPIFGKSSRSAESSAHAGAASATGSPGRSASADAIASGNGGDGHVWTPARPAAYGSGRGGAGDGLDSRGLAVPEYPAESRRQREEGVVELEVQVLDDGRVGGVRVLNDAGFPRLAEAAAEAIRRSHFTPASCDGRPVAGAIVVPYRFVLR